MKVKLEDIISAIATSTKATEYYYDIETGDLEMTIDGEILGNSDIDITNQDRYLKLPDRYELDEEKMMEDFANHAKDPAVNIKLLQAISEDETLKKFRDTVQDLGVSAQWDRYRNEFFRQAAIDWCDYSGVDYIDEEANPVIAGAVYEHFKGKRYTVIGVAKHSETLDDLVIYQAVDGDRSLWARPKSMFVETVEVNGEEVPRFRLISE